MVSTIQIFSELLREVPAQYGKFVPEAEMWLIFCEIRVHDRGFSLTVTNVDVKNKLISKLLPCRRTIHIVLTTNDYCPDGDEKSFVQTFEGGGLWVVEDPLLFTRGVIGNKNIKNIRFLVYRDNTASQHSKQDGWVCLSRAEY